MSPNFDSNFSTTDCSNVGDDMIAAPYPYSTQHVEMIENIVSRVGVFATVTIH